MIALTDHHVRSIAEKHGEKLGQRVIEHLRLKGTNGFIANLVINYGLAYTGTLVGTIASQFISILGERVDVKATWMGFYFEYLALGTISLFKKDGRHALLYYGYLFHEAWEDNQMLQQATVAKLVLSNCQGKARPSIVSRIQGDVNPTQIQEQVNRIYQTELARLDPEEKQRLSPDAILQLYEAATKPLVESAIAEYRSATNAPLPGFLTLWIDNTKIFAPLLARCFGHQI